jgi:hypothetical protein
MKSKTDNIKKLLDLNGGRSSYESSIVQTIEAISHLIPDFNGELKEEDFNEIIDDIYETVIPIYDENFTDEEILGLIDFFQTDIGKIYLKKMGKVAIETMQIGKKHGELIYNKLKEKSGK